MGTDRAIKLLILDFDGVCTRSAAELIEGGEISDLADAIRPEATITVATATALGLSTVILSNEFDPRWRETLPLAQQVDQVICCADNRIFKPDRRAFQRCLLVTGHSAAETLVVDDDVDNVAVAASLGMDTVLFDPANAAASWETVNDRMR